MGKIATGVWKGSMLHGPQWGGIRLAEGFNPFDKACLWTLSK